MPFGVTVKFDTSAFRGRLAALGEKVERKVLRAAVKAAAVPVIAQVRANLLALTDKPGWTHTGLTAKAIGIIGTKSKGGRASAKVGACRLGPRTVRQGRRDVKFDPANILHLIELGTRPHALGAGSSLARGSMLFRPFGARNRQTGAMHPGALAYPVLAPAVAATRGAAQAEMERVVFAALGGS